MIVDKSRLCAVLFAKYGRKCTIHMSDGRVIMTSAILQQLWRKLKTKFEPVMTRIGEVYSDYYAYYGPADCDITAMTSKDILETDGIGYYFVRTEKVNVGNTVQYYAGILKRIREGDHDVFG